MVELQQQCMHRLTQNLAIESQHYMACKTFQILTVSVCKHGTMDRQITNYNWDEKTHNPAAYMHPMV